VDENWDLVQLCLDGDVLATTAQDRVREVVVVRLVVREVDLGLVCVLRSDRTNEQARATEPELLVNREAG